MHHSPHKSTTRSSGQLFHASANALAPLCPTSLSIKHTKTQQHAQLASCVSGPHNMPTTPLSASQVQCPTHRPSTHLVALGTSSMPLPRLWRLHLPHCFLVTTHSSGHHVSNSAQCVAKSNAALTRQVHNSQLWAPLPCLCQCCGAFSSHTVV